MLIETAITESLLNLLRQQVINVANVCIDHNSTSSGKAAFKTSTVNVTCNFLLSSPKAAVAA